MESGIHKNAGGVVFEPQFTELDDESLEVPVPIGTADVLTLKLRAPSGEVKSRDLELTTDGDDGKARYTTNTTDLDEVGLWCAQAYARIPGGFDGGTDWQYFQVFPNL
ncbi:MAG: hypothetical protein K1X74_23015 [Pirellulales bacterium]|nr:hypothetical protein [Pirellulales bacterium]